MKRNFLAAAIGQLLIDRQTKNFEGAKAMKRMFMMTAEQHTYISAVMNDAALDEAGFEDLYKALAMLKAMQPLEPVAYQFQTVDGGWHPFLDDKHYQNTLEDGRWPIRALYTPTKD